MTTVATERPASPYDPALAPVERVALAHQQAQADIRAAALAGIVALWATLDVDDLFGSWFGGLGDLIFAELSAAQELAAMEARDYVYWAVRAQDRAVDIPRLDPLAMAGRASDGRDLDTLLLAPVYRVYGARAAGASPEQALAAGEESLRRIVHTQVTDAGREADQLAVVAGDVVDVDDDVDLFSDRTAAEIIDEVLGPAAPPATAPRQRPAPVVQPTAPQSSAPPLPPAPPPRMTRQERREAVRARREAKLGWVRMLTPPSCSRCAVLAGKWYPWSAGFQRHPNCFPAGVVVSGPPSLRAARRRYEGQLVIVRTAAGEELPATPNHPVLTARGWLPAHLLREGDEVVRSTRPDGAVPVGVPDHREVPARIEDAWAAHAVQGLHRVPVAPEDFHGDGAVHSHVDVVGADGLLYDHLGAALAEQADEQRLAGAAGLALALAGGCGAREALLAGDHAADGVVRGRRLGGALLGGHPRRARQSGLGSAAGVHPPAQQMLTHGGAGHAVAPRQGVLALPAQVGLDELGGDTVGARPRWDAPAGPFAEESRVAYAGRGLDLLQRIAGQVALDRVVEVRRIDWSGHVYNLTSAEGWYSANGLIVSNCDCRHIPAVENDSGDLTTDPALYFESLSREDQDALFGQANAQAIRDGADVTQVVNASTRPGAMFTAGGRRYTREGTTRRGFFRGATAAGQRGVRRPTPLQIYRDADGDREVARAELVRFGYIIE